MDGGVFLFETKLLAGIAGLIGGGIVERQSTLNARVSAHKARRDAANPIELFIPGFSAEKFEHVSNSPPQTIKFPTVIISWVRVMSSHGFVPTSLLVHTGRLCMFLHAPENSQLTLY